MPVFSQEIPTVSRSFEGRRLNELAVWNLGDDKVHEIYITSVAGHAGCYVADRLEPIWQAQLTEDALTAPVIGQFMGSGAPIMAVGSASGKVYFLWPASGEVISTIDTGLSFSVAPSLAKTNNGDLLVLADDQGRVAVLNLDRESGFPSLQHLIPSTLPGSTTFSVVGGISQPPSCADLNGDGAPEIVYVSDSGVLQVVSLSADNGSPPKRYHIRLPQQSRAGTLIGMGLLSPGNQNHIALGVDATVHVFSWDPSMPADKAVQLTLQAPGYGRTLGHLLFGPVNSDDSPDLISTADSTIAARYLGTDLSGGQVFLDIAPRHLTTSAPPFSPAVPVIKADGATAIVAIDGDGIAWEWLPTSSDNKMNRIGKVPVPYGFTPAGDLLGNGKLSLAIWNENQFTLSIVTLPIDVASSPAPQFGPVLTAGVNYSRNGQWGQAWATQWQEKLSAAAAFAKQARTALETTPEDSELTTDAVSMLAGVDPNDSIAIEFRNKQKGSGLLASILVILLALLLAVAAVVLWRARRSRR